MEFNYDIDYVRKQFPATDAVVNNKTVAILDGPGGTQVPTRVVEKINDYLFNFNANEHGMFSSSLKTDELIGEAREIYADFFGCSPDEVAFGANSTTNNFMLSYALRRDLKKGDEIIVTDIDHLCNRSPWIQLEGIGCIVKSIRVDPETCQLDFEHYKSLLSYKTKIVAINYAANAVGTITDVKKYIELAHEAGAVTIVDAVHYAAHKPIDVKDINTDILICSSYKFFGPHLGIVYIKKNLFEKLETVKVDADDILTPPLKFQTGTPNFEHICGAAEAVSFIQDLGIKFGECFSDEVNHLSGRRQEIVKGMLAIDRYEEDLAQYLRTGLRNIEGVKIYGPPEGSERTSTVSFTIAGINSNEVSKKLGEEGIFSWDGDFYAVTIVNSVLNLTDQGGLVRLGLAPYNTLEDVKRTLEAIKSISKESK